MPKTLRVYAGSELESRCGEQQFILRHLKKAVCWVASSQYNIHAFMEASVLDELAESALAFLFELGRQTSIVISLTGRRQANYIDILNALYIKNKRLYEEFLNPDSTVEYSAPPEMDDEPLKIYTALRLGRNVVVPPDDSEDEVPLEAPSLIDIPPTFLEVSMQRLTQHGTGPPVVPYVTLRDIVSNPLCTLPTRPGAVTTLADVLESRTTRAEFAQIENTALVKFRNHLCKKDEKAETPAILSPLRAGVLKRPTVLASEQTLLLASLAGETPPDVLPLKGLPLPWPSDLPDWAPLIPADADSHCLATVSLGSQIKAFQSTGKVAEEVVSAAEKVALQLELCDIEADYPQIHSFNPDEAEDK
eukprot:Blabericola_migrator_1__4225@NODE_2298_length_2985_cov_69_373544_g685_i1_p1_GENE_NODE_2298_length_2985_cov_69_373544_g685_i1NODE_2298_length_2985_cov_69_373544_g685_i1_p1_ORF_typecomplete_len362_score73_56Bromo_TP/PF07524_13/0_017Bromo_TP/PF07524_13/6_4e02_NODE_2298_length_2985_cov_69_373544_g685_i18051890